VTWSFREWGIRLAACLGRALDHGAGWASAHFVGRSNAAWLCKLALEKIESGEPKSADRFARWAVAAAPDLAISHKTLGYVYFRTGQLARARDTLEEAIRLSPSDGRVLQQLADVYYSLGDYAHAEEVIRGALRTPPRSARDLMMLGLVLLKQRKLADALVAYTDAAAMQPGSPKILGAIGETKARMEHYHEAVSALESAVALDPELAGAHFYLAVSLANLGQLDRARKHAQHALELDPNNGEFREILRVLDSRLTDPEQK